jgi:hypothetical protein
MDGHTGPITIKRRTTAWFTDMINTRDVHQYLPRIVRCGGHTLTSTRVPFLSAGQPCLYVQRPIMYSEL